MLSAVAAAVLLVAGLAGLTLKATGQGQIADLLGWDPPWSWLADVSEEREAGSRAGATDSPAKQPQAALGEETVTARGPTPARDMAPGKASTPNRLTEPRNENVGGAHSRQAPASVRAPIPSTQEAPEEMTLDSLIERSAPNGGAESALAALFALWNIDYAALEGANPCEKAASRGLACLRVRTSLTRLANLDRPALIMLQTPNGRRLSAVISSLNGSTVTLEALGRKVVSDVATVASLMSGEYVILWRPPPAYHRLLSEGLRGKDVAWVQNHLAMISGMPATNTASSVFDSMLKEKVIAFQRSRGLKPDGIVGARTMIHLITASGIKNIPVLIGLNEEKTPELRFDGS